MRPHILVVGGAGYIGSHMAKRLQPAVYAANNVANTVGLPAAMAIRRGWWPTPR